MRGLLTLLFFTLAPLLTLAQTAKLTGTVEDATTGEPLVGANVTYQEDKGTVTDIDGQYSLELAYGTYEFTITYVGYKKITKTIEVNQKRIIRNFSLQTEQISEVEVVADVAIDRQTPVAHSDVELEQIKEELGSRDLPMVLNSTPGVYATQQGGGDGEARITIRGFSQRNVGVMIDGIPVNDMENGWVYWSNWFGLDMVTKKMQVQRGLGATKVALPSVGGTINILTKGIDSELGFRVKQELGNDLYSRTSIGFNSGEFGNGWGITLAGSFKRGDGWVDKTFTRGYFYFAKIQKKLGDHQLSVSALGAPQSHGQRSNKQSIETYSHSFASDVGIDSFDSPERGLRYNQHWGYLNRYEIENGDTIRSGEEELNERVNTYHKPMFTLKDFWQINDKLYWSNMAYASMGWGGGTRLSSDAPLTEAGQVDFQKIYNTNRFGPFSIDPAFSNTLKKSTTILQTSVNNHYWYGLLSTADYQLNESFNLSGGVDLRDYKGEHYREVEDLLGGDYYIDRNNKNQKGPVKEESDKISYHNDSRVRWGGLFGQLEYSTPLWSTFLNVSGVYNGYKRIDYFRKKDLVLEDTVMEEAVGYNDTINHQGKRYHNKSSETRPAETEWKWIPGFTIKAGANYNINEHHNVFANIGYLSRTPRFRNVISFENNFYRNIKNEMIKAVEMGYSIHHSNFKVDLNGYATRWENKPGPGASVRIDGERFRYNINGMDARHLGAELKTAYQPIQGLNIQGIFSYGDWTWQSKDTVRLYDDDQNQVATRTFDAKGVHVGDAAQTQIGGSVRWEIIDNLYAKGRITHFARHYADFDPLSLKGENAGKESWKIPPYQLVHFYAGYDFTLKDFQFTFRAALINALNTTYIAGARNNDPYIENSSSNFDASSAGVFFGQGRRFNLSLEISY
ncbi:MAG: hypothetical protein BRD50_00585 [Bacteroidetes bacterium SW_11_45_7]|nr:MAG: hypothetical protein BRD50_00585 [Bacteroidetes bacterium SW_11_45_7]